MCEETKCEDCKCEAPAAPAFDMFAEQSNANDEIGQTILNSISKIAEGVLTLQQEIVLLGERVEAHEAHLAYILSKDSDFQRFLKDKEVELREAAVAASQTEPKTEG